MRSILYFSLASIVLTTLNPTQAHAQSSGIQVFTVPQTVVDNREAWLMATGCPDGPATFTWRKDNSESRRVTSTNGLAVYQHNDYNPGDYSLTVSCGGNTTNTTFKSISHNGQAFILSQPVSTEDYICTQSSTTAIADPGMVFATQEDCSISLQKMRNTQGDNPWVEVTFGNQTYCDVVYPIPPRKPTVQTYSSYQACEDALSGVDTYKINYSPLQGDAQCLLAQDGIYASKQECEQNLTIIMLTLPGSQEKSCRLVPKTAVPSNQTEFDTKAECQEALDAGNSRWFFSTNPQTLIPCTQNPSLPIGGGYDTLIACEAAFCSNLDRGIGILDQAFKDHCEEIEEEVQRRICPICRNENFPHLNFALNVCCKNARCEAPSEIRNQIEEAIAPLTSLSQKQQRSLQLMAQNGLVSEVSTTTCTNSQICSPGKGCAQEYPNPVKPPCIGGYDSEGNTIDIEALGYLEDGKIKADNLEAAEAELDKITHCTKVNTAVGIIDTSAESITRSIFGILLSISGMVALFIILKSGYQMMTSQGNPEVIQAAKDSLTSAIVGLLFLIFSMVILQVIGVDILQLPGFGG